MSKIKEIIKRKSKDIKPGPNTISRKLASFWKEQVNAVDEAQFKYIKRGNQVIRRYRDERTNSEGSDLRRMNLLWTNISIMMPAILSDEPVPNIDRKFNDKDPTARLSATILERSLRNEMEDNKLYSSLRRAVKDYMLPGRGQVWVRYEPEFGKPVSIASSTLTTMEDDLNKIQHNGELVVDEDETEEKLEDTGSEVISESCPVDYIDWKDFYMFPSRARTWDEVQAVGKRLHISKEEAIERFGEEIGSEMRPDTAPMGAKNDRAYYADTAVFQDLNERSIVVFEIWNKTDRRAYWYSPGYDYLCDVLEDPLKLKNFFPCPPPLNATMTNDTLIPVPDFHEWQDQALQIDELTQRIAMLTKACKIAGTYDAANGGLKRLLQESTENQLIPVDQWAVHAEKGGVKGSISFLPLEEIQSCIATLQEVRQQTKQDLDEVTGLSDILRGTTDSRETLGGLRLKNNNAGTRLTERQNEVSRFALDTIRICAEIMAKHFTENTLIKTSGILYEEELSPESVKSELTDKLSPAAPQSAGGKPGASAPSPQQGMGAPGTAQQQPPQGNVVPFPPQQAQPPQPQQGAPVQQEPFPDLAPLVTDEMVQEYIAQKVQKSIDLLRNDIERGYRIDIETDSTIFGDQMQERQDAVEFGTMVTKYIMEAGQAGQAMPEAVPLFGQMLEFMIRKFKAGRDLENAINIFVEKAGKKAKEAEANPPPDPEQQKAEAEIKKIQMTAQSQKENDDREAQRQAADDQRTADLQKQDDIRKMMMQQSEDDRAEKMAKMELAIKEREFNMKMQEMDLNALYVKQEHEFKLKELDKKAAENNARRAERKKTAGAKK